MGKYLTEHVGITYAFCWFIPQEAQWNAKDPLDLGVKLTEEDHPPKKSMGELKMLIMKDGTQSIVHGSDEGGSQRRR